MNRRKWFSAIIGGGNLLLAGIVGIPAMLVALSPAFQGRGGPLWRRLGRLEDFPLGSVQKAIVSMDRRPWQQAFEAKAVYVWRPADDELVVFSRNCTDLSCPVNYDPGSECFFCPCHGGIFAKDGTPMAGPPKYPLYRYQQRIENGVIEIDLNSLPPMT